MSRLETGQRRPSLELLLPLAQIYRVPIDDLVGAPEVGDPRIRLKPRRLNGRTVLPLTGPDGVQAWKILVPATQSTPWTHDGFEWLYVLSGRMRLVLGDQDLVLGVGEAAQFDTQVAHWFGSTGEAPAEILSIFGRPGERMQIRAISGEVDRTGIHIRRDVPGSSPRAGSSAPCCADTEHAAVLAPLLDRPRQWWPPVSVRPPPSGPTASLTHTQRREVSQQVPEIRVLLVDDQEGRSLASPANGPSAPGSRRSPWFPTANA